MTTLPAVQPVASLQQVLAALADPVRLEMVRRLADAGQPIACGQLYAGINKSTASHHFKVLRESGVLRQRVEGRERHSELRAADLEKRFPGLLHSVLGAK